MGYTSHTVALQYECGSSVTCSVIEPMANAPKLENWKVFPGETHRVLAQWHPQRV